MGGTQLNEAEVLRQNPGDVASARLARDSVFEFMLTFALLFGVTTIVRWVMGPSPVSRLVPQIHVQLVIVGAAVGLLLAGLILSPPGRASGGHVNPAISLAMWRFGVFPGASVVPYAIAQLLGSVLGVVAAREVWGSVVSRPPVVDAVLQPGPGWSAWESFAAEAVGMAIIIFAVGVCLARHRLTPLVPWVVGGLVGMGIVVLGTATGGSLNPVRQFGPAEVSGQTQFLWVYLLAPMVGAAVAACLQRAFQRRRVLTHKLCGEVGFPTDQTEDHQS
jgi:glycerol uptake facilitator-like aquaporin